MTPVQWLFHYLEIEETKKEKTEEKLEIIKAMAELLNSNTVYMAETVIDAAKLTGAMANPEAGKAMLEAEQLKASRADIADDDFCEWWEDFSSRIPSEFKVEDAGEYVDLEGDAINLEKLYEIEMEMRKKQSNKE